MGKLDKMTRIPLYLQIKEQLLAQALQLKSVKETPQRIESEEHLAKFYEVSRMTVRQAIQELVDEGVLYKVRGIGTFVNTEETATAIYKTTGQEKHWDRLLFGTERGEVLFFDMVAIPAEWADCLRLEPGTEVLHIIRRRWQEGVPVAMDYRYVGKEYSGILDKNAVAKEPLFGILSRKLGVVVERNESMLGAIAAGEQESEGLLIPVGTALLKRRTIIYLTGDVPVISGESVYRSDRFRYSLSVK